MAFVKAGDCWTWARATSCSGDDLGREDWSCDERCLNACLVAYPCVVGGSTDGGWTECCTGGCFDHGRDECPEGDRVDGGCAECSTVNCLEDGGDGIRLLDCLDDTSGSEEKPSCKGSSDSALILLRFLSAATSLLDLLSRVKGCHIGVFISRSISDSPSTLAGLRSVEGILGRLGLAGRQ